MAEDPDLARAVEEHLAEMEVEQEFVELREKKERSKKQFAARTGACQPYVARLEPGQVQALGLKTLVKYAKALGSSVTVHFEPARHQRRAAGATGTTQRSCGRAARAGHSIA